MFLYKDPNDIFTVQSVLFQIALTSSTRQPRKKVNILTKNPFQKRPMICSNMPIPSFENLALIHFIYPKHLDEISLYLSALGAIPIEKSPGLLILYGLEDYLSKNLIERIQQIGKILDLVKELKISCIVALKLEENINEESEMAFKAKMHLFASEVWTLEDQEEKVTTSSPHTSEKGQLILEFNKGNGDSKHDMLTYSKEYFSKEIN